MKMARAMAFAILGGCLAAVASCGDDGSPEERRASIDPDPAGSAPSGPERSGEAPGSTSPTGPRGSMPGSEAHAETAAGTAEGAWMLEPGATREVLLRYHLALYAGRIEREPGAVQDALREEVGELTRDLVEEMRVRLVVGPGDRWHLATRTAADEEPVEEEGTWRTRAGGILDLAVDRRGGEAVAGETYRVRVDGSVLRLVFEEGGPALVLARGDR